jgi:hypothetical protein
MVPKSSLRSFLVEQLEAALLLVERDAVVTTPVSRAPES